MSSRRVQVSDMSFHLPRVSKIDCPKKCGWYREWSQGAHFEDRQIDHPLYGPVSNRILVQLDVKNHDCIEAANARLRAKNRKRNEDAQSRMVG